MPKRGGLGKGLEAIFGDIDGLEDHNRVVTISVDIIESNPYQPRESFDDKAIDELAESIREKGIIQPIIVRENGDKYQIVAGERRFIAAKRAGLKTIPALIKNVEDEEAAEIALIENIQRKDLNPIEEAKAYKNLIDAFHYTQEELAKRIGKDRATIANSLRLLSLPDSIIQKVKAGLLTAGHARAILSVKDESIQRKLADEIVNKKLSVRDAEVLAKKKSLEELPKEVNKLKELFDNVKIKRIGKKFKVEFSFDSEDELIEFARNML